MVEPFNGTAQLQEEFLSCVDCQVGTAFAMSSISNNKMTPVKKGCTDKIAAMVGRKEIRNAAINKLHELHKVDKLLQFHFNYCSGQRDTPFRRKSQGSTDPQLEVLSPLQLAHSGLSVCIHTLRRTPPTASTTS